MQPQIKLIINSYTTLSFTQILISDHVSSCDIEEGRSTLLAEDTSIKREYMGTGVKRIPLKVKVLLLIDEY